MALNWFKKTVTSFLGINKNMCGLVAILEDQRHRPKHQQRNNSVARKNHKILTLGPTKYRQYEQDNKCQYIFQIFRYTILPCHHFYWSTVVPGMPHKCFTKTYLTSHPFILGWTFSTANPFQLNLRPHICMSFTIIVQLPGGGSVQQNVNWNRS